MKENNIMNTYKMGMVVLGAMWMMACSTNSFLPVHDYENGTTLGQRTLSDPHAFSPGAQRSWMEVCNKKVIEGMISDTVTYTQPCKEVNIIGTQFVSFSPYVNGLATPLIQAGAIVGGAALIGDGLSKSGSTTNIGQTNTGGNSSATGGNGGIGGNSSSTASSSATSTGAGSSCRGNCR